MTHRELAAALALAVAVVTTSARAAECDVKVDPNFPLYMVTVDGKPFKNKRYVAPDDALQLRDALIGSGMCDRSATVHKCTVRQAEAGKSAGKYVVFRGTVNFDPYKAFSNDERARVHARKMADRHLCAFD